MKNQLSKEQLFEHFDGKSSLMLKQEIEAWLQNPTNEEQYYSWLEDWERQHIFWKPDTEDAYQSFRGRIENSEIAIENEAIKSWWRGKWAMSAAASIVLLLSAYVFRNDLVNKNYTSDFGAMQQIKLEDGTVVTLNSNSTLSVPRFGFGQNTREVQLKGEAYFSVTHTPSSQKFVVKTDENYTVEVLGTEFSVKNRNHGMRVVLDKGKVKVRYDNTKEAITMKPGDLVTLEQNGVARLEKLAEPKKYSAWRVHKFVFEKTKLSDVAILLQDNFGLKVTIASPELMNKSISGEIEARTADELLTAITEIFDLKIIKTDNTIIFKNQ